MNSHSTSSMPCIGSIWIYTFMDQTIWIFVRMVLFFKRFFLIEYSQLIKRMNIFFRYHLVQHFPFDYVLAILRTFWEMPEYGKSCCESIAHTVQLWGCTLSAADRIFSLHMKEQPIEILMKQLFTFNNNLLKSVSEIAE